MFSRYICTAALDALGKARRPVEALNLFCRMQVKMLYYAGLYYYLLRRIHCNLVSFSFLSDHYMQGQIATYPDIAAYHCIAVTLGQAGHMRELFDVIDTMRSPPKKKFRTELLEKWDPRLEPDIVVYNAVSGI